MLCLTKIDRRKSQHFHCWRTKTWSQTDHLMECFLQKKGRVRIIRTWSHIQPEFHFRRSQQENPSFNYHNNLQAQERPRNLGASPLSKGHFGANRNVLSLSHYRSPQWMPPAVQTNEKTHRLHHDFVVSSFFSEVTKRIKTWAEKSSHRTWIQSWDIPVPSNFCRTTWDFRKPHETTWKNIFTKKCDKNTKIMKQST